MTYDRKCHELAKQWLQDYQFETNKDTEIATDFMAQRIQHCLEDFVQDWKLEEKK